MRLHVLLVDRLDYLSEESFFSSVKKIEAILALTPDIPGGLELRGRRTQWGYKRGNWEGCQTSRAASSCAAVAPSGATKGGTGRGVTQGTALAKVA
jgi:hypothetical protein